MKLVHASIPADNPEAAARVLADGIPGSELVIVDDAGHMVHLEQPAAYSAAVESFLSR